MCMDINHVTNPKNLILWNVQNQNLMQIILVLKNNMTFLPYTGYE